MSNKKLKKNHCLFYHTGGVNICVEADIPITDATFQNKFKAFTANGPGQDTVFIRHHFPLPDLNIIAKGTPVYQKPPWVIYKQAEKWIYMGIVENGGDTKVYQVALINRDHTQADIYHANESAFKDGKHHSLTLFPTDQILLARVLADREGCYFHSSGIIMDEKGFLFAGHSDAGKSTVIRNLAGSAEILCDDRIIVRKIKTGFRLYGTWSHGDISQVSSGSAALKAILFLEQSNENRLIALNDNHKIIQRLLALMIKPLVTFDWWEKMLSLVEKITLNAPCYILRFQKNSDLTGILRSI